jgi:hypothetical protein
MNLSLDTSAMGGFGPNADGGALAMLKNTEKPWTPRSFFDPPRVNAPEIVEFGTGKTYDFFA